MRESHTLYNQRQNHYITELDHSNDKIQSSGTHNDDKRYNEDRHNNDKRYNIDRHNVDKKSILEMDLQQFLINYLTNLSNLMPR